jgi:multiple sugar transport system permease protein
MNRSYYWLITALSIPAFLWLIPTLWMVSLSFQPNEVLARTTSTTAFGLIPLPFTAENYAALFSFGQTPLWFLNSAIVALGMTLACSRSRPRRATRWRGWTSRSSAP